MIFGRVALWQLPTFAGSEESNVVETPAAKKGDSNLSQQLIKDTS